MGLVQTAMFNNGCQLFEGIGTDRIVEFGFGNACLNVIESLQLSPESKKVTSKYAMASGSCGMS